MISIAMTTYNGGKYLSEQIDSILLQNEEDFELIICDDCSSDNTIEILEKYSKLDKRIKYYRNEINLGYMKNFEKAISLCRGDYIALSDQDDIWMPNHLSILKNTLDNGNYSLVGANSLLVDENNESLNSMLINHKKIPNDSKFYEILLLYKNYFQGSSMMFKSEVVKKALPLPDVKYHDWWIALIASEMNGVTYVNEPIIRYRQHSTNASGQHKKDNLKNKISVFFENNLKKSGEMIYMMLSNYKMKSEKKQKIEEVICFAQDCINGKFRLLTYFVSHYDEMFFSESRTKHVVRVMQLIFNIIGIKFFSKKR